MKVHRRGVLHEPRRHLGDIFFFARTDGGDPIGRWRRPIGAHALDKRGYTGADIADEWGDDRNVAIDFLRLDVDLDELLRSGLTPGLAFAVRQKPVEAGSDERGQQRTFGAPPRRSARPPRAG